MNAMIVPTIGATLPCRFILEGSKRNLNPINCIKGRCHSVEKVFCHLDFTGNQNWRINVSKSAIYVAHFDAPNYDFYEFLHFVKADF